ncbi:hypothetical protein [Haloprofundus salilacus]|uniref:hypothetical protein n=1 Tax=Haloprofundus salilacus TaxID=2876190 RepID=UPI001CCD28C1|nr:hypothetical protein [Haloprofundus salilacus]
MSEMPTTSGPNQAVIYLQIVAEIASQDPETAFLLFWEATDDDGVGTRSNEHQLATADAASAVIRHPPERPASRFAVNELQCLLQDGSRAGKVSAAETVESLAGDLEKERIDCLIPLLDTLPETIAASEDDQLVIPAGVGLTAISRLLVSQDFSDAIVQFLRTKHSDAEAERVARRAERCIEREV